MNEELAEILQEILNLDNDEANLIATNVSTEKKLLRLTQILKSKRISEHHISKNAYSIRWFHTYFLLESMIYFEPGKKSEKLRTLFRNGLTLDEKKLLLKGFTFSEPFSLGDSWYPCRHEMFNDFNNDDNFKEIYMVSDSVPTACSFNTCYCGDWLDENEESIDGHLNKLVDKFREMRNSYVHEAFPIIFLPSYEDKNTAATFTASVIDAYPISFDEQFRAYECFLDPDEFFPIITNCMKVFLTNKYVPNE